MRDGNVQEVERILQEDATMAQTTIAFCDAADRLVSSASTIFIAVYGGHEEIVRLLLAYGADANSGTLEGHTPLLLAAERGSLAIVRALLEHNADLEMVGSACPGARDMYPLHMAARDGHYDSVVFLVQQGADVNDKDVVIATPLTYAVIKHHELISQFLLRHGAVVENDTQDSYIKNHFPGYDWRVDKAEFHRARKESLMNTFALPEDLAKLILALEGVAAVQQKRVVGNSSEQE